MLLYIHFHSASVFSFFFFGSLETSNLRISCDGVTLKALARVTMVFKVAERFPLSSKEM